MKKAASLRWNSATASNDNNHDGRRMSIASHLKKTTFAVAALLAGGAADHSASIRADKLHCHVPGDLVLGQPRVCRVG